MKSVLTLVFVGALAFSSLAMASDLSSSDSGFLFGKDQVAATTISSQEMQQTQGQLFSLGSILQPVMNTVAGLPVVGPTASSLLNTVLGSLNGLGL
jgi:hypothetical protein